MFVLILAIKQVWQDAADDNLYAYVLPTLATCR